MAPCAWRRVACLPRVAGGAASAASAGLVDKPEQHHVRGNTAHASMWVTWWPAAPSAWGLEQGICTTTRGVTHVRTTARHSIYIPMVVGLLQGGTAGPGGYIPDRPRTRGRAAGKAGKEGPGARKRKADQGPRQQARTGAGKLIRQRQETGSAL